MHQVTGHAMFPSSLSLINARTAKTNPAQKPSSNAITCRTSHEEFVNAYIPNCLVRHCDRSIHRGWNSSSSRPFIVKISVPIHKRRADGRSEETPRYKKPGHKRSSHNYSWKIVLVRIMVRVLVVSAGTIVAMVVSVALIVLSVLRSLML